MIGVPSIEQRPPTPLAVPRPQEVAGSFYLPQLDGLRFLAAALVFFYHAAPVSLPFLRSVQNLGWCGVDLFLVLSAFLLTRLITLEFERKGSFSIKHFYVRRLLRIWPLHWGFVTAMLVVHWYLYPAQIKMGIGYWLSHIFFINNVVLATLGFETRLAFTSHLWTVSLEEQFYLVIPLVMTLVCGSAMHRAVSRKRLLQALAVVLMVLMAMRASCVLLGFRHPFIASLPLRGDPIVLGVFMAIGYAHLRIGQAGGALQFVMGLAILALVEVLPSLEVTGIEQVPGFALVALGCGLMLAGVLRQNVIASVLAAPPFRYLGKISFGIYVYHMLCLAAGRQIAHRFISSGWWAETLVSAGLTIAVAAISYRFYEKHFLILKERFTAIRSRPA